MNLLVRYNDSKYGTTTSLQYLGGGSQRKHYSRSEPIDTFVERPYYQLDVPGRDPEMFYRVYSLTKAPARKAGELTGMMDFLTLQRSRARAWSYTPGQRRVGAGAGVQLRHAGRQHGGLELFDQALHVLRLAGSI